MQTTSLFRRSALLLVFPSAFAGVSCSSSSSNSGSSEVPVGLTETTLRIKTGVHTVMPGDAFECFYTDVTTDKELHVNGATGTQGLGGHHITIYYTDQKQPVGHHTCDDAEMTNWHQVGGAASDSAAKEGVIDLPPGIAMKVPPGQQIVIQTHYINATAKPRDVEDDITVKLLRQSEIKEYANAYVIPDQGFRIPPQSNFARASVCTLDKDLDFLMIAGHMHEWGSHYKLERLAEDGSVAESIFDLPWEASFATHPPTKRWTPDAPYHLPAGTKIRQTCEWKNTSSDEMRFPREMCVVFTWYLKDQGFLICDPQPEESK